MRYAILGGDMRFAHLARMFSESGRISASFLQGESGAAERSLQDLKKFDCIISNWPMKWPLSKCETSEEEILYNIAPGSVMLLCGPGFPKNRRWDLQYINLWEDEILLQENAWLTAEAAVASAMRKRNLAGMHCMVVGYGRIGRALTEILANMNACVTVVTGSESKCKQIEEGRAHAVLLRDIARLLPDQQLIFTTPPVLVLSRSVLENVNVGASIIDLASPPYGVDLEAAQALGLDAVREPGLPGRYCPESAARVLYNAIIRWEEGEYDKT